MGKSEEEILYKDILYNTKNIASYQLLAFTSGGYAIYMPSHAIVLEYSTDRNGHIFLIQDNKTEVYLEDYADIEALLIEYAEKHG